MWWAGGGTGQGATGTGWPRRAGLRLCSDPLVRVDSPQKKTSWCLEPNGDGTIAIWPAGPVW